MNRGEVMALSLVGGALSIFFYYFILYFFVFENLLIIVEQLGHNLYPVESELWWFLFGFGLIIALRAVTKTYRYGRRNFCPHCSKEIKA